MTNPGPAVTNTSTLTQTPKSSGGYQMGQSITDLIGFYGKVPVAQQASTVDLIAQLVAMGLVAAGTGIQNDGAPVNITAAGALSAAANAGRVNTVNSAAGIALTLPAALGTGNIYMLYIGTTVTSIGTTIAVNGSDTMSGQALQAGATGAATAWNAAANGTITLNGTTKGGFIGDFVTLVDIAAGVWDVQIVSKITGTAATPFS